jgi:acetoin utilization deacetylase AcuC-like enzyme
MLVVTSSEFAKHVPPPGHPERVERAHVFDTLAVRWAATGATLIAPRLATDAELARVHDEEHLEFVASTSGRATMIDADTFTSPDSYVIARLAAGATVQAAEHALATREPAIALVRPPGHHAERDRAMGFCLYNNAAVAAAAVLDKGLQRVAIVDIDVHHGNGTQAIFERDPRVLYISTHQYPFYPGTGATTEIGRAEGEGFTVNVPLEAGARDEDYALVYNTVVTPVLDEFRPELVLVSAGYDAHERDPLASMRVTASGFAVIVRAIANVANRHGALALVTEGGYELTALAESLDASVAALTTHENRSDEANVSLDGEIGVRTARAQRAIAAVRSAQKPYWKTL